jgi:hypothetical protein
VSNSISFFSTNYLPGYFPPTMSVSKNPYETLYDPDMEEEVELHHTEVASTSPDSSISSSSHNNINQRRQKKRKTSPPASEDFDTVLHDQALLYQQQAPSNKPFISRRGRGGGHTTAHSRSVNATVKSLPDIFNSFTNSIDESKKSPQLPRSTIDSPSLQNTLHGTSSANSQISNSTSIRSPTSPQSTKSSANPTGAFFTIPAQLTFRLPPSSTGVNVVEHFTERAKASFDILPYFALLSFDHEKGQQVSGPSQIIDDKLFYNTYFHNHRALQHGNLTGMVHFQTSTSWGFLKNLLVLTSHGYIKTKSFLTLQSSKPTPWSHVAFLLGLILSIL